MKLLSLLAAACAAIAAALPCSAAPQTADSVAATSPDINAIAWFCQRDSVVYEIVDSEWTIEGSDTTLTAGATSTVLINVVDSTANGFKLKFQYLDTQVDTIAAGKDIKARLADKFTRRLIGTSFDFETDEVGTITGFTNLREIKKTAKNMMKDIRDEVKAMPEYKAFKDFGFNLEDLLANFDSDMMVEGLLNDVKTIFALLGNSYPQGETTIYQDSPVFDEKIPTVQHGQIDEDESYTLTFDTESPIPNDLMMQLLGGMLHRMKDNSLKEDISTNIGEALAKMEESNPFINRFAGYFVLPNGWPMEIMTRTTISAGGILHIQQKNIDLTAYSFP